MRCLLSLLFLLVVSTAAPAQANGPKALLSGDVTDPEGAALKGARVIVIWDSSGGTLGIKDNVGTPDQRNAVTDVSGKYSIELPPGFYDVFVSAGAFSPTAAKVRVRAGQTTIHDATLHVDPTVSSELSGTRVEGTRDH
jgi:Carboxypeptidase regulatory-like domain